MKRHNQQKAIYDMLFDAVDALSDWGDRQRIEEGVEDGYYARPNISRVNGTVFIEAPDGTQYQVSLKIDSKNDRPTECSMNPIDLEKRRELKKYEAFLESFSDRGLRDLNEVSDRKTLRQLENVLGDLCNICDSSEGSEEEFGEIADSLQDVVDFFRRHQKMLESL